jgi:steroid delta-isomerase-like uncharacterized protein
MFERNVAAAQRLLEEAWSGGDLDVLDELCADGYVDHDPVMGDADVDAMKERIAAYRAAFPDLRFEVDDAFAADDKVVLRWHGIGTFENAFMGQEPTHEKGDPVSGISIDRFEDGKLAESWGQWNALQFMRNIGAVPEGAATSAG